MKRKLSSTTRVTYLSEQGAGSEFRPLTWVWSAGLRSEQAINSLIQAECRRLRFPNQQRAIRCCRTSDLTLNIRRSLFSGGRCIGNFETRGIKYEINEQRKAVFLTKSVLRRDIKLNALMER